MNSLFRRVSIPRATLLVWTGLLAATVGVPPASASRPFSDFVPQGACSGATVRRQYTAQSMTFTLRVSLDGCPWWDGSSRNLAIWLSRDDGSGPADRYEMSECPSECDVSAALPHQPLEQAVTYQGEATWQWKDGPRRVSFETRCTTNPQGHASCADPVEIWHDYD
jgi:hypothetical protein